MSAPTPASRTFRTMNDPVIEVEVEIEVSRREKVRFTTDVSEGPSESGATWETGRFWRTVNYHVQSARDLVKREDAQVVRLRFIQPCSPEQMVGDHDYEHIEGSDSLARCKRCGRVEGK
jgi:hypothetical protein